MERKHWKWVIIAGAVCVIAVIGHLSGSERREKAEQAKKESEAAQLKLISELSKTSPRVAAINGHKGGLLVLVSYIDKYQDKVVGLDVKRGHKVVVVHFTLAVFAIGKTKLVPRPDEFRLKTANGKEYRAGLFKSQGQKTYKVKQFIHIPPGKMAVCWVYFSLPRKTDPGKAEFRYVTTFSSTGWIKLMEMISHQDSHHIYTKLKQYLKYM